MPYLAEKIEKYAEELFEDLDIETLSEERKADIFARVEEHFHRVLLTAAESFMTEDEHVDMKRALEENNYKKAAALLEKYPEQAESVEKKIDHELANLKVTIKEEEHDRV